MARTSTGSYTQRMIGVSVATYKNLDALRLEHESFEKFFKRILPLLKKVSK